MTGPTIIRQPLAFRSVTSAIRTGKNVRLVLECGHTRPFRGDAPMPTKSHCPECPPDQRLKWRPPATHVMPDNLAIEKRTRDRDFVMLDGHCIGIVDRKFSAGRYRYEGFLIPGCTNVGDRLTKRCAVHTVYLRHKAREEAEASQ